MSDQVRDMTTGSPSKLILLFAVPLMLGNVCQQLYTMVDTVIVGQIAGVQALAALGAVEWIMWMVLGVSTGITQGFAILMAQDYGAQKWCKLKQTVAHSYRLTAMTAVLLFIISQAGAYWILTLLNTPDNIIGMSLLYLRIVFCGIPVVAAYNIFANVLRSLGNSRTPLIAMVIAAIINIILDPIMIFGLFGFPRMEVTGAALATVTGQIIAAIAGVIVNMKLNKELHISLVKYKISGDVIRSIYSVGFPSIIMASVGSVMTFGMNKILMGFTSTATAVFGVYFKLQSFIFMPVFGLNNGMVPIVAYNYGARKPKRITKAIKLSIIYGVCIMLAGFAVFQLFPGSLLGIFSASDDMMAIGIPALRTISLSFLIAGFSVVASSVFQALGHGFLSLAVSVLRQLVVLLPAAFILSKAGGLGACWWSFPIAEVFSGVICFVFIRYAYKKEIHPLYEK